MPRVHKDSLEHHTTKHLSNESTKVIFVGNSGSQKTSTTFMLLGKQIVGELLFGNTGSALDWVQGKVTPTQGMNMFLYGSNGQSYNIWDCAGDSLLLGLDDGYYKKAKVAFVFSGGESFRTPQEWVDKVKKVSPNAQIIHVSGDLDAKVMCVKNALCA